MDPVSTLPITSVTKVDENIHNRSKKIEADDSMFMSGADILNCIKYIKLKNTEGYDQIPQRIIIDGISILIKPLTRLFEGWCWFCWDSHQA